MLYSIIYNPVFPRHNYGFPFFIVGLLFCRIIASALN